MLRGAAAVALLAALMGHVATALRHGSGVGIACATVQAAAIGVVVWGAWPQASAGKRWAGPVVAAVLLGGLALGGLWSARDGLLAVTGLSHAMLYGGLLALFGGSLRRGRVSVVTRMARALNPQFHDGMLPYTRGVTVAWCVLFAGQLVVSALLLAGASDLWPGFVSVWHVVPVLLLAMGEHVVRRWRWRHGHVTGFWETVRGARRLLLAREP